MTKLSDIQLVLLSTAAARADGSLLPPPETVAGQAARIRKTIPTLLKRGLVSEVAVSVDEQTWRQDGERKIGVVITPAGCEVIGVPVIGTDGDPSSADGQSVEAPEPITKIDHVLRLLRRGQGATLSDLVEATGWLPHTTRAALTGLRKKGHAIARDKRDGVTTYSLSAA
jgi:hypothetical protein